MGMFFFRQRGEIKKKKGRFVKKNLLSEIFQGGGGGGKNIERPGG